MDQSQRHRLVLFTSNGVFDPGFQHLAAINDCPDLRNRTKRRILLKSIPVAVEGDQARFVLRHILTENSFHAHRQRLEHLALFHHGDPFKSIDVIGMHWKEPNKLIHTLIESTIVFGKRHQIVADLGLLCGSLFKQTLGYDKFHVTTGNKNLLETILHPTNAVSDKSKTRAIEDGFLNASHESEA